MRILVTGGSGFLGRHLVAELLQRGHQVTVLSRTPERITSLPPEVRLVGGVIREGEDLTAALAEAAPDVVVHAAAIVNHRAEGLADVNVGGTAALLLACRTLPTAPRFVLVSSFAVEDPPATAYSDSKEAAEALVTASKLPWVIVRPTLIYGPADGGNTDALVASLASGLVLLPGGGRVAIQPVHVQDVALALAEACERKAALGRTYRLGGADPVSVRAFRAALRDASGGRARLIPLPLGLLGPLGTVLGWLGKDGPRRVLSFHRADHAVDSSDARRDLGFAPQTLAEGVAATFPA